MYRKILYLIVVILILQVTFAQVVTTEPEFATQNDSLIIFFDATKGDQGLMGYTGNVYVHTGVTINGNRWQNVIGDWGNDSNQPELTRMSSDLYKLVIGDPHIFYGVNAGTEITELSFVFRSEGADGPTGRDVGGNDIFLEFFTSGISVVMVSPEINNQFGDPRRTPIFAEIGDTVQFEIRVALIETEIDTLILFHNEEKIYSVTDSILNYDFIISSTGQHHFRAVAIDTNGYDAEEECFIMSNPIVNNIAPPADIHPGIQYPDVTNAILCLFAPFHEFAYVIGDFNNWMVDTTYFMNRYEISPDSVLFWLKIENLSPGTEYGFQYLVNGDIRIADPYSNKIQDPWNDKYISNTTYPNLIDYPKDKTEQATSVLLTTQSEFSWTDQDYEKPLKKDLVIYELLIRDFLDKHDFATLIDSLDYLENLGVTAIELMPVSEFEGNISWGYNPSFYFAVDKYYGPAADLKAFINECHNRGIAVITDLVLNHSFGQSPLVRLYWNSADNRPASNNPWYNEVSPNQDFSWGYDFNHESVHTKYFIDRVNKYWIDEYHFDGFRFDFTKGFTNTPGNPGYDNSRIQIIKRMADKIWEFDASAYVILEHWADNNEEKILSDYKDGMMLWGNSNWNYCQAAMGYQNESDFSWGFYKSRGWSKPHLVTYMESHDEERMMFKNLEWGNGQEGYSIKNLPIALNRIKLAAAFFLTLPGPKMIWQFGELGYDYSIDYNGRVGEKPIKWEYFQNDYRRNLYKTFAALTKLRKENDVFTNPATSVSLSLSSSLKRIKMSGSMNVIIIGNFDVIEKSINPDFQHGGKWYDYFSGDSLDVVNTSDQISLQPGEFKIYTDSKLESPEQGILTDIQPEFVNSNPEVFQLLSNYPNPFNATTTLKYSLEKDSQIHLKIVDLSGREVFSREIGYQNQGYYSFHWNGKNSINQDVHSGIYFVILKRGNEHLVEKITLLK